MGKAVIRGKEVGKDLDNLRILQSEKYSTIFYMSNFENGVVSDKIVIADIYLP